MLSAGTPYKVRFSLGKLVDVKPELRVFAFDFMTINQNFDLNGYKLEGHSGRSLKWNRLEGRSRQRCELHDEVSERLSIRGGSKSVAMVIWRPSHLELHSGFDSADIQTANLDHDLGWRTFLRIGHSCIE